MTEQDLDFSGFQAERKVDVPPPPKKKSASGSGKLKSEGKKGRKKKALAEEARPEDTRVEEPPPQPEPEPAISPRPVASAKAAGRTKAGRKKRVNVSLPVELSQRFTDRAALQDRYLTDMVLDAYRDHYAEMREGYVAEQGDADLPFRPRRRKAASGRVTHMLYLAAPEIAVIDGSASEVGLSRSELVSQLLERELA